MAPPLALAGELAGAEAPGGRERRGPASATGPCLGRFCGGPLPLAAEGCFGGGPLFLARSSGGPLLVEATALALLLAAALAKAPGRCTGSALGERSDVACSCGGPVLPAAGEATREARRDANTPGGPGVALPCDPRDALGSSSGGPSGSLGGARRRDTMRQLAPIEARGGSTSRENPWRLRTKRKLAPQDPPMCNSYLNCEYDYSLLNMITR